MGEPLNSEVKKSSKTIYIISGIAAVSIATSFITGASLVSKNKELASIKTLLVNSEDDNTKLKSQIDELQNGASKLLALAQNDFDKKDYDKAKQTLNDLLQKHPTAPEADKAKQMIASIDNAVQKEKEAEQKQKEEAKKQQLAQATSKMQKKI
jgi:hypothetical protein